jgi:hypothetical protein
MQNYTPKDMLTSPLTITWEVQISLGGVMVFLKQIYMKIPHIKKVTFYTVASYETFDLKSKMLEYREKFMF